MTPDATEQGAGKPFHARRTYRLITAALGLLLCGVGACVLILADTAGVVRLAGGAAFVTVGGNMVWSAVTAKESWLSRLGPLP
ncbi:hypothetical protein [Zeimonas arvi]|uniref:Uncharacterized protein n=1 Tax=Zeimonas arvi TaxID=2498847 RepID=A0A5C8P5G5_9BURK|nr:hypothetical protein [Zeimonas arvi]TXL68912.1 hypothetical protein FHP08_04340 [Zeimonas arvi]